MTIGAFREEESPRRFPLMRRKLPGKGRNREQGGNRVHESHAAPTESRSGRRGGPLS